MASNLKTTLVGLAIASALAVPARAETCGNTVHELPASCDNAALAERWEDGTSTYFRCVAQDGSYLLAQGTDKPDGGPFTYFDLDRHEFGGSGIRARLGTAAVDTIVGQDWGHDNGPLPNCYGIFSDGFESGHLGAWSAASGCFGHAQGMPFSVVNGTFQSYERVADWGARIHALDDQGQPLTVQGATHPGELELCVTEGDSGALTQVSMGSAVVGNGYGCQTVPLPQCGTYPGL